MNSGAWLMVVRPPGQSRFLQILSVLSPEDTEVLGGIPNEAIAGRIGNPMDLAAVEAAVNREGFSVKDFRPNPTFSVFMHHVIRSFGPDDSELQEAARQQNNGWVYIIDLRTPEGPMGRVPVGDIVGGFAVQNGVLGEYWANEKHEVFTVNGLFQLPPSLQQVHLRELKRLDWRARRDLRVSIM